MCGLRPFAQGNLGAAFSLAASTRKLILLPLLSKVSVAQEQRLLKKLWTQEKSERTQGIFLELGVWKAFYIQLLNSFNKHEPKHLYDRLCARCCVRGGLRSEGLYVGKCDFSCFAMNILI